MVILILFFIVLIYTHFKVYKYLYTSKDILGYKMVFEQVTSIINLNDYTKAIVLFFALFFILRVALYFIEKLMIRITSRTKTDLDDLILKKSSKPLTVVALLISLTFALRQLTLISNH